MIKSYLMDDGTLDTVILVKEIDDITGLKIDEREFRYQYDADDSESYEEFISKMLLDAIEEYKEEKVLEAIKN